MSESAELEPWQQRALEKMKSFQGRGTLQVTGRGVGKSTINSTLAMKRLFDDVFDRPLEAMTFSEGKIYGARYYTVEPIGGNWRKMEHWCFETFGDCGDKDKIWGEKEVPEPGHRWYMNNRKFWFREQKDRDWFVIRWNS